MASTYSIRQPRRCGNGAEFTLSEMRSGAGPVGSIHDALMHKVSETLATYGSRRARRLLEKMKRAAQRQERGRGRT